MLYVVPLESFSLRGRRLILMNMRKAMAVLFVLMGLTSALAVRSLAGKPPTGGAVDFAKEPACSSLVPASQGGPAPKNPDLIVVRWLGVSNEEVAFRHNIFLIDAWYDRTPPARPLGFDRTAVKKATAIFIDHAHGDHIADVPFVAKQTGAPVYGAPISIETVEKFGVPATQTKTVTGKGGELLTFDDVTVEPVLALHHDDTPEFRRLHMVGLGDARDKLLEAGGEKRTPEQEAQFRNQMAVGSMDQRVITEGTIDYLFTFPTGYKIYYHDAAGTPTEYEKAAAARIGSPDVGIFAYSDPLPDNAVKITMMMVDLFKPHIYMPIHHDDVGGTRFETPVEPIAMAIRDKYPDARTISPLYRTPVCLDIKTKQVLVGP